MSGTYIEIPPSGGGGGGGNVIGPGSSTDSAVARWDSTTGQLLKNSSFIIDDAGVIQSDLQLGDGFNFLVFDGSHNQTFSVEAANGNLTSQGFGVFADNAITIGTNTGSLGWISYDGSASFATGRVQITQPGDLNLTYGNISVGSGKITLGDDGAASFANGAASINTAGEITTPLIHIAGLDFAGGAMSIDGGGNITAPSYIVQGSSSVLDGSGLIAASVSISGVGEIITGSGEITTKYLTVGNPLGTPSLTIDGGGVLISSEIHSPTIYAGSSNNIGLNSDATAYFGGGLFTIGYPVGGSGTNYIADDNSAKFGAVTATSFTGDGSGLTNIPNPFNQSLNTADSPNFAGITMSGITSFNSYGVNFGTGLGSGGGTVNFDSAHLFGNFLDWDIGNGVLYFQAGDVYLGYSPGGPSSAGNLYLSGGKIYWDNSSDIFADGSTQTIAADSLTSTTLTVGVYPNDFIIDNTGTVRFNLNSYVNSFGEYFGDGSNLTNLDPFNQTLNTGDNVAFGGLTMSGDIGMAGFYIVGAGNITATNFIGNGAALTNVNSYVVMTNDNATTVTFNANSNDQTIYDTSGTLVASQTIVLPTSTRVGQTVRYVSARPATSVTVTGTVSVGSALTALAANASVAWQAVDASGTFIRIQ